MNTYIQSGAQVGFQPHRIVLCSRIPNIIGARPISGTRGRPGPSPERVKVQIRPPRRLNSDQTASWGRRTSGICPQHAPKSEFGLLGAPVRTKTRSGDITEPKPVPRTAQSPIPPAHAPWARTKTPIGDTARAKPVPRAPRSPNPPRPGRGQAPTRSATLCRGQALGRFDHVGQQHGPRHGTHPTGIWRDPSRHRRHVRRHVPGDRHLAGRVRHP